MDHGYAVCNAPCIYFYKRLAHFAGQAGHSVLLAFAAVI